MVATVSTALLLIGLVVAGKIFFAVDPTLPTNIPIRNFGVGGSRLSVSLGITSLSGT